MAPVRRPENAQPPTYSTVQLFHGGVFISSGSNWEYVDAKTVWYDFCEMDKWSPLVVEDIIEDLGYEMAGRVIVFLKRASRELLLY
uniref:PB1-like domain-containing protein n=1 Tax=Setaria italica TaxID=4555 RepID=K3YMU3_SETIT